MDEAFRCDLRGPLMQCFRCGRQNKATNEYCEGCGATLGIECSACGHLNGSTARFCGQCSAALKSAASTVSNQSWQHVLKSLYAKGGERKRLTILFADIRNSTGLIDSFGDPDLQIRVGVHTGEVVVQAIEHGMYQTYDAAGANVHLANRMEQLADAGTVLISKETYTAAKQFVEVEPLGPQTIRGIAAPIEIFKLRGLQHAPSSGVFRSGRRLSPLTGRNDQYSALALELENTIMGDGRVVGVVGEAGIGKSRLCFEFAESCRGKGIRVFEARVLAHGRATPFQPVLELLRDYFGLRVKEAADVSRRRVLDRLAALSVPEQTSSVLFEFLGLADPLQAAVKLDPKTRKTLLLDFVRTLPRSGAPDVTTVV